MDIFSILFSPSGRLAPKPFALTVVLVYVVNFFSQTLLSSEVTGQSGFWPFVILQFALVWIWVVLHIKRLRDAGRSGGLAIGIACLYGLALVLVLLIAVMIASTETSSKVMQDGQGLLRLFLVLYLFAMLTGSPDFGVITLWLLGFGVLLLVPVFIGLGYSVWAGTRPSLPATAPA